MAGSPSHTTRPASSSRWARIGTARDSLLEQFADSVRSGLTASPKFLECAWLYDAPGSQLFEQICALPEYYLTRAEEEIFRAHGAEIVAGFPPDGDLVELGSGSGVKTRALIECLLAQHGRLRYVPIDISISALEGCAARLLGEFQALWMLGIRAEYADGLDQLAHVTHGPKFVLWLGSSIGNFPRDAAARFLGQVRSRLVRDDRMVVGLDLRKDARTLELAYDDPQGVTARFNLNLLARIDRELGGHFADARFRHRARYEVARGRVELGLESLAEQRVAIDGLQLEVEFSRGEFVHTEDSYKYSLGELEQVASAAGFELERTWLDRLSRFCVARLTPRA